jgi:hypothetical protein
VAGRSLGRRFGWLWAAYGVSVFGTWLAFDAFPLIAVLVLHAGPIEVSVLAAAGTAAGAVLAVSIGPRLEARRKRSTMVTMDLVRFAALVTVPVAYLFGQLGFVQLLVVSVLVAAADITFRAASGAWLKSLVAPADLLMANSRLESTNWTAVVLGPPLGGAAIGLLGPVVTVVADAVSYLLSALGLSAAGRSEPAPSRTDRVRTRPGDLLDGWRVLLGDPVLRRLLANSAVNGALIMATSPLLAVLLLGRLGFAPWQYGLAYALPCVGGLAGSRLVGRLVRRFGRGRVLRVSGTLRACWSVGLAFVPAGVGGIVLVVLLQLGLVSSSGVYNPVLATERLTRLPAEKAARALTAWMVTGKASTALVTALWGLLAAATGTRVAIAAAGVLLLATPLLLPRLDPEPSDSDGVTGPAVEPAAAAARAGRRQNR